MVKNSYKKILHLPHHVSDRHPRMPMADRAAQFSPFAALTGYKEAIGETARLTQDAVETTEYEKVRLDRKLRIAEQYAGTDTAFRFTQFVPDEKKSGGRYENRWGRIRRINRSLGQIQLEDRSIVEVEYLTEIWSECFNGYEDL